MPLSRRKFLRKTAEKEPNTETTISMTLFLVISIILSIQTKHILIRRRRLKAEYFESKGQEIGQRTLKRDLHLRACDIILLVGSVGSGKQTNYGSITTRKIILSVLQYLLSLAAAQRPKQKKNITVVLPNGKL